MTEPRPAPEPLRAALDRSVLTSEELAAMTVAERTAYIRDRIDIARARLPAKALERIIASLVVSNIPGGKAKWLVPRGGSGAFDAAIDGALAALQAFPQPESRAVELLRELVELEWGPVGHCAMCGSGDDHLAGCLVQRAHAFLADSAAPPEEPDA